jgi:Holliday junction resolvase RusA-like endonuclease
VRFLTPEVKAFRAAVEEIVKINDARHFCHGFDRIRIDITAFPPDARRRDLDNLSKAVQDAFQIAELYKDDFYIDSQQTVRGMPYRVKGAEIRDGGRLKVTISELFIPPVGFEEEFEKNPLREKNDAVFLAYAAAKKSSAEKKKNRKSNKKKKENEDEQA